MINSRLLHHFERSLFRGLASQCASAFVAVNGVAGRLSQYIINLLFPAPLLNSTERKAAAAPPHSVPPPPPFPYLSFTPCLLLSRSILSPAFVTQTLEWRERKEAIRSIFLSGNRPLGLLLLLLLLLFFSSFSGVLLVLIFHLLLVLFLAACWVCVCLSFTTAGLISSRLVSYRVCECACVRAHVHASEFAYNVCVVDGGLVV